MDSLHKIVYQTGRGLASVLTFGKVSFAMPSVEHLFPGYDLVGVRGIMADAHNFDKDSRRAQHLALGDHIKRENSIGNVKRGRKRKARATS